MNFSGPTIQTLNKWAANALRKLAGEIESSKMEDGFTPVTDAVGKAIGEVYIDYSGEVV